MELSVKEQGTLARVRVAGCFADKCGDEALGVAVRKLLKQGRRTLLLDLSGVTETDSTGLAELAIVYEAVRRADARLELLCPSPKLRAMLELTGLQDSFPIHCSADEATQSLSCDESFVRDSTR